MFNNQVIAGSSGQGGGFYDFPLEQSLRFNSPDQPRLTRAVTHNTKTFTINFWVKRANLGRYWLYGVYSNSANTANLNFDADGTLVFYDYLSAYRFRLVTTRVFRDVGAWYCITLSVDTTQSTASDRIKIFVNGVQETSFSTATYPSQNLDLKFGGGGTHAIGTEGTNNRLWWDGYLANWALIDGQALDPTSFGEFKSGIWIPKDVTGLTYGSGGYLLEFADSAAIGDDTSGNTNDWTANNLAVSDVVPDSPTNNFATMNPNDFALYLSEGNLKVSNSTGSGAIIARSTMLVPPNSGKWYFEGYSTVTSANGHFIGVWCPTGLNAAILSGYYDDQNFGVLSGHECVTYLSNGTIRNNSSSSTVTGLDDFDTAGDIVGVLLDMDAQTVQFYNNGSAQGSAQSLPNTTDPYGFFAAGHFSKGVIFNFGQDSTFAGLIAAGGNTDANGLGDFKYAPPSGALSPCSANLPQGAIDTLNDETPEDYFNTVLWTGNNTNNRSITGVGFQPSLVSAKSRSAISGFNWVDAVRGGTKNLQSNTTSAEATTNTVISFDTDGFTVGDGNGYDINKSGEPIVGWSWKANGAGVSNTDGSITSTVSVGATSQQNWFSIVGFTTQAGGYTVGHGLGQKPSLIITKNRTVVGGPWYTFTDIIDGSVDYLALNQTTAKLNDTFGLANPTSSVFSLDDDYIYGTGDCIAYCFANAENLCKVGTYVGNGSTDGIFIYTGHKPSFLLIKETGNANSWELFDTARDPDNVASQRLFPNTSAAEATTNPSLDILSNGFKARAGNTGINRSGGSYIFLSIASQPFKYANAR